MNKLNNHADSSTSVMEAETISKNAASPKSLMSKMNFRKLKGDIAWQLVSVGFRLQFSRKFKFAIIAFKIAIKIKPKFHVTYKLVGDVYLSLEQYELSAKYYQLSLDKYYVLEDEAKEVTPLDLEETYKSLGAAYITLKQYRKTVECLTKAINDHNSQDFRCYGMLGDAYFGLEDYLQSIKYYQLAHKLNQNDTEALPNIGKCYLGLYVKDNSLDYCRLSIINCYHALRNPCQSLLRIVEALFLIIIKNHLVEKFEELAEFQQLSKWFLKEVKNDKFAEYFNSKLNKNNRDNSYPEQEKLIVKSWGKDVLVQKLYDNVYKIFEEDDSIAVGAEYALIRSIYPDYKKSTQALTTRTINGKEAQVDIITIELPDGSRQSFMFDITIAMSKLEELLQNKHSNNNNKTNDL
jgi:hypothetical protein